MGFSHLGLGPIFAPASNGDIFLTDDFERAAPALQPSGDADATVKELAGMGREAGLSLLLDIVLDRVAAEGTMARSAPHWFYRTATTDVVDPRQAQLGLEAVVPINERTGKNVGIRGQVHFFIDDIFPNTLGKPLFQPGEDG